MFNPLKLKFKKEHKNTFKNKEYSLNKTSLLFGDFGIASKVKGVLYYKEIAAVKKIIAKKIKGVGIFFPQRYPKDLRVKKKKVSTWGGFKGPSRGLSTYRPYPYSESSPETEYRDSVDRIIKSGLLSDTCVL